jgi:poly(A) polymerase
MDVLKTTDPKLAEGALFICRQLQASGHQAFLAGGVVRDLLAGREVSDIDVATSAEPSEVESIFERTLPVGKSFGVMIVLTHEHRYEVATFRREGEYKDGRRPEFVQFSGAQEDALRRDFTVNAIFYDPISEDVIDFVGGREDLKRKLLRTVGTPRERFQEDKLRLLRAVRIACQLELEIDAETWKELTRQAESIRKVSRERIGVELIKMLTGPAPARGLRMLLDSGLLQTLLPEVAAMEGVAQPPQFHPEGDVWKHTCLMFEVSPQRSDTLALGILLHDVGKPPTFQIKERIRFDGHAEVGAEMAAKICRRLRMSRAKTERVEALVRNHLKFIHVREMRESTLKRFLRQENFDEHLELHRLDCLASHGDLSSYEFCMEKLQELDEEAIRPAPLIRGNDLIELGLQPGPLFSEILSKVEDLQLEGILRTRRQALAWVRARYLPAKGTRS